MDKAKEILCKHAKSNGCKSDLLNNPFLEQAVLNAINEALTIPAVVGQSEQYCVCEVKDPEIKAMWVVCANCNKPIRDE